VPPFEDELIEALETHTFAAAKILTWRNRNLNYDSISSLQHSLEKPAEHRQLMKAPPNADIIALDRLSNDPDIIDLANSPQRVRQLWEVVKTPDYRKISPASHAEILSQVYLNLAREGKIDEIWFADQVAGSDNTNGELDALSTRIANIRTCTYLSNRDDWLENATEWREKTREVEDRLSDALHETLTKRFIDRRTSILMKRLKENRMLEAEIGANGAVSVEGHAVGHLKGFRFIADSSEGGKDAKALNAAATKALSAEIEKRADRLGASPNSDIILSNDGTLRWLGEAVAKLSKGDTVLKPRVIMLADEQLTGPSLDKAVARLGRWVSNHVNTLLKPLADLEANQELNGIARGVAFRLVENLGILERKDVAEDLKNLDQDMRGIMRHNGVRFGAYHVFVPILLKPAPSQLICILWAIANEKMEATGLTEIPSLSAAGRTSAPIDEANEKQFYGLSGFKILGAKAVRIDILERLADLIRPTTSWKADSGNEKPEGAVDGRAFYVTPAMLSILGATHEDMIIILKGLGYKEEKRLEADIKPAPEESPSKVVTVEAASTPTETASTDTASTDEATNEEPAEPKSILIWRYGGGGNKKFSANQQSKKKFAGKPHAKGNKPNSNRANNKNKPQKPEKQPDPDSPFAALAALKGNLK
jgi:ATP-dependent RNA helicase SUPV3L1/SUV3